MNAHEINTATLRNLTAESDALTLKSAHDALHPEHLAELAKAHTRTIRLTEAQSRSWEDDSASRAQFTARAQRRADRDGKPWIIVSRASILLATVNPAAPAVESDNDDVLDFGASLM